MPSSTDHPSVRSGHGLRHGGQGRATGIDDQADDERPPTADHVADLGAGEDQHRHHQAVEGDDGLDRRHRGVEVLDQLTDRDVHHGLVEHHEELRRGQGDQRRPAFLRGVVGHRLRCRCLLSRSSPALLACESRDGLPQIGHRSLSSSRVTSIRLRLIAAIVIVGTQPVRPRGLAGRGTRRCRSRARPPLWAGQGRRGSRPRRRR